MPTNRLSPMLQVLTILVTVLIGKVVISVVLGYRDYFPPNFKSDFLFGREAYFWDGYHTAFYVHLFSGPPALLFGTLLVTARFREWWPKWHRKLGKLQVACVLLFVVPSGLWMAYYAATGTIAAYGLGSLAIATGTCVLLGWRAVRQRRFLQHERWMWRTFLLLCSAVVIRIVGGLATVTEFDSELLYPISAWLSWLGPLAVLEITNQRTHFIKNPSGRDVPRH